MRIERHIFGSIDGYRTLAHSPGLLAADCQFLEGFAFGTPYDPAIRTTFARQPAYWARPLGAHRRAITQIRPGEPDDAGRPTLLFLTAVVPTEEWNDVLQGDASSIMQETALWKWQRGAVVQSLELPLGGPSPIRVAGERLQVVLGMVSRIEAAWGTGQTVVIREGDCDLEQVIAVERLLPPDVRERTSIVYRALNAEMPVTLSCLAQSATAATSSAIDRPFGATSPYARRLVQAGVLEGRDAGPVIRTYNRFAQTVVEEFHGAGEEDSMDARSSAERGGLARGGVLALCVGLLAFAAGGVAGWTLHRPAAAPSNPWPDIARRVLQVPLAVGPAQVEALQALPSSSNSSESTTEWRAAIDRRLEIARLGAQAEETMNHVDVSSGESVRRARDAVEGLREQDASLYATLRSRLEQLESLGRTYSEEKNRVGAAAEEVLGAMTAASGGPPAKLTEEQLVDARCLRRSLDLLVAHAPTLATPEVQRVVAELNKLPQPANRSSQPDSHDTIQDDTIRELNRAFRQLGDALPGSASKPSEAECSTVVAGLRAAAQDCLHELSSNSQPRRVFGELADLFEFLSRERVGSPSTKAEFATLIEQWTDRLQHIDPKKLCPSDTQTQQDSLLRVIRIAVKSLQAIESKLQSVPPSK